MVYVFLADGFEEIEAIGTIALLKRAGLTVDISCLHDHSATGRYDVNITNLKNLNEVNYKDYIIYIERKEDVGYHFGLSVGKKVGNAVTRNKVKRQLRSIIDEKNYQNGLNCIIIVKKGI